jgi:glycerate kinase
VAAHGAELRPGAAAVLEAVGFARRLRGAALAVTGEGELDGTTAEGKAPAEVARACAAAGVRCVVAAGRVRVPLAGAEARELSGDPAATAQDLRRLGGELAAAVLGGA